MLVFLFLYIRRILIDLEQCIWIIVQTYSFLAELLSWEEI